MNPICIAAWVLAILTIPLLLIAFATETQGQRIRRLARQGMSQRSIAARLGITRHRVRLALAP